MSAIQSKIFMSALGFVGDRVEEAGRSVAIAQDGLLGLLDAPPSELRERVSEILARLDEAVAALEWER